MIITVTEYMFIDAFRNSSRADQFSEDAMHEIFENITALEEGCEEKRELDIVAICCEYAEEDPYEIAANYDLDYSECDQDDDEECREAIYEALSEHTWCVECANGNFVYVRY